MVLGPTASELREEYDKKKDNSKIDAITDDTLKNITSKIKPIFDQIDAYITYINGLGFIGNIDTFEDTKISELEQSVTDLVTSINEYNAGSENSTADNVKTVNDRLQELTDLIAYIATSDKGRYWDQNTGGVDPAEDTEKALLSTSKNLAAVKLKESSTSVASSVNAASNTQTPTSTATAAAATTPGAVAFTIQGEINIATKQISKITSIQINDCEAITDIKTVNGKINEDKGLTDEITKCITSGPGTEPGPGEQKAQNKKGLKDNAEDEYEEDFEEEELGGGRKRRATAKKQSRKRPRRKSYRRFQSRRRKTNRK
jgi:hypothetical protein